MAVPSEYPTTIRTKRAIVWFLIHNGTLEDRSGKATALLAEKIRPVDHRFERLGIAAKSSMLLAMERDGLIRRLVNGKRTMMVEAAVSAEDLRRHPTYGTDPWPTARAATPDPEPEPQPETPPTPDEPETPLDGPQTPPAPEMAPTPAGTPDLPWTPPAPETMWTPPPLPADADPHALLGQAMAFISQAIATSRPVERTDPDVLRRLSDTLEENQRLRRRLDAAGDELRALRTEAAALRTAKGLLETNLQTIANGRLDVSALRRFREWDQMVRSAPTVKRNDRLP